MKFYIATGLDNWREHNNLRDALIKDGHVITYDWTVHGPVWKDGIKRIQEVAIAELNGIIKADTVIVLYPGGRGTHVELGYALALMKPVIFYSPYPEHYEPSPDYCAFYAMTSQVKTLQGVIDLCKLMKT